MDIIRRFLVCGRPGIYFKVLREGEIGAADEIQLVSEEKNKVKDIVLLYVDDKEDIVTMQHAARIKALAKDWRDRFRLTK